MDNASLDIMKDFEELQSAQEMEMLRRVSEGNNRKRAADEEDNTNIDPDEYAEAKKKKKIISIYSDNTTLVPEMFGIYNSTTEKLDLTYKNEQIYIPKEEFDFITVAINAMVLENPRISPSMCISEAKILCRDMNTPWFIEDDGTKMPIHAYSLYDSHGSIQPKLMKAQNGNSFTSHVYTPSKPLTVELNKHTQIRSTYLTVFNDTSKIDTLILKNKKIVSAGKRDFSKILQSEIVFVSFDIKAIKPGTRQAESITVFPRIIINAVILRDD